MRIAVLTTLYRDAIRWFYQEHTNVLSKSYQEHKQAVDDNLSLWAVAWQRALVKKGYEVLTIPLNVDPLLVTWAEERGYSANYPQDIIIKQLRQFEPEIVWYDSINAPFLQRIKSEIPSIRLVLGWFGSPSVAYDVFRETHVVFSCAPETVNKLTAAGFCAYHIHHAFDPVLAATNSEE